MKHRQITIVLLVIVLFTGVFAGCSRQQADTTSTPSPSVAEATATPAPATATPESSDSIPNEYIGYWEGSVDDIALSFDIGSDGTGTYTFEQSGYSESYDFTLEAGTETFSVKIPKDNTLGIAKIEGTYVYSDGILTLDVRTTFVNGRVFEYTVPCQKS